MSDTVLIAIIGGMQAISTALIAAVVRANSCGGDNCRKVINESLWRHDIGKPS